MATELELATHAEAARTSPAAMAAFLQDLLGQRLTAIMLGQKNPRVLDQWARSVQVPQPEVEQRLREVYHIVSLLMTQESDDTVRGWLTGMNPYLGDRTPAIAIAGGDANEALHAARAFLAGAMG